MIQCKPLNVITGECYRPLNVIKFQSPICYLLLRNIISDCYHSVNVITFGLVQSDHIKRLLLYKQLNLFDLQELVDKVLFRQAIKEKKEIGLQGYIEDYAYS